MTRGQARKAHLHLGHAGMSTLRKLFDASCKPFPTALLEKIIQDCGRITDRKMIQRPIVRTHIPVRCCDTVGLDVMYPIEGSGHSRPYLIMVDRLSRYTVIARMLNHKPEHVVDLWFKYWAQQLGKQRRLIADQGPAFIGNPWSNVADFLEIQITLINNECPYENGMVEPSVALIKRAFVVIKGRCANLTDGRALLWATMSRNLAPNFRSGLSPSYIMLGRSNLLDVMESKVFEQVTDENREMLSAQLQLSAMVAARNRVMKTDAQFAIASSMTRPLRNNASEVFRGNDMVAILQRIGKESKPRWHLGYRTILMTGRYVLVERPNKIFKAPLHQVRATVRANGSAESETITPKDGNVPVSLSNDQRIDPSSSSMDTPLVDSTFEKSDGGLHNLTDDTVLVCKMEDVITGALNDVVGECANVDLCHWGALGNKCEWEIWSTAAKTSRVQRGRRSKDRTEEKYLNRAK